MSLNSEDTLLIVILADRGKVPFSLQKRKINSKKNVTDVAAIIVLSAMKFIKTRKNSTQ
jgi:hypothetical protein